MSFLGAQPGDVPEPPADAAVAAGTGPSGTFGAGTSIAEAMRCGVQYLYVWAGVMVAAWETLPFATTLDAFATAPACLSLLPAARVATVPAVARAPATTRRPPHAAS